MKTVLCNCCGKTKDEDECNILPDEKDVMCYECSAQIDFISHAMYCIDLLQKQVKKLSMPIMATEPYKKWSTFADEYRWFIRIAFPNGNEDISTEILIGETKQEVEQKLVELRKKLYGVA